MRPKHPLVPPNTFQTPSRQPLNALPVLQKALTLSRKVDECKPLGFGGWINVVRRRRGRAAVGRRHHGRAVQVDPIRPMLKAPGCERLKVTCDDLLSMFAFNFNLRRYTMAGYTPRFHPAVRLRAALDVAAAATAPLAAPPRFTFTVTPEPVDTSAPAEHTSTESGAPASAGTSAAGLDPKASALVLVYDSGNAGEDADVEAQIKGKAEVEADAKGAGEVVARAGFVERAGKLGASAAADEDALLAVVRAILHASSSSSSSLPTAGATAGATSTTSNNPTTSAAAVTSTSLATSAAATSTASAAAAASAVTSLAVRLLLVSPEHGRASAANVIIPAAALATPAATPAAAAAAAPLTGPAPGMECLRAAAEEVAAAGAAYQGWVERLTSAVERRGARSNHRWGLSGLGVRV